MSERVDQQLAFEEKPLSRQEYISALIHLYRGEMHRAITWRQRLDTTTNWAVFVTGTLLSFLFTDPAHDNHIVGIIGMFLVFFMLCYEARRFRYFDVWRSRVRKFEENFYAPLLRRDLSSPIENWGFLVAEDLLTPRFKISYLAAMRARLVRNYIPIFIVLFSAWVTKLVMHPRIDEETNEPVQYENFLELFKDTGIKQLIPWWAVTGITVGLALFLIYVAFFCRPGPRGEDIWWSAKSDESVDEIS